MKKNSWVCTLITQISLCFALFLVFQIGQRYKPIRNLEGEEALDVYFISVRGGGYRTLQEQSYLIKQIEKVIKAYKAKFVINVSEFGEDDPLNQIATRYFQSFNVPWYTTKSSNIDGPHYFLRKIKAPNGNNLDVVFVNTGLFQDNSSVIANDQLKWMERAFKSSDANWRILAGLHPLVTCNRTNQAESLGTLYNLFQKHRVNAYIGGSQACSNSSRGDSMDIEGALVKGPDFTATNQILSSSNMRREHDFLLHRVSSLEMVTYYVTLAGDVVYMIRIRPLGREAM